LVLAKGEFPSPGPSQAEHLSEADLLESKLSNQLWLS
jgi:hypothetical protein